MIPDGVRALSVLAKKESASTSPCFFVTAGLIVAKAVRVFRQPISWTAR